MQALYFCATILTILILVIGIVIGLIRKKSVSKAVKILRSVIFTYVLLWIVFYYKRGVTATNFGEDICFDDWCATVISYEKLEKIGYQNSSGQFIILTVQMTNKARGISQKPSEPRVHIIDDKGNSWGTTTVGQKALEDLQGQQVPLDQRLELNQSLQTKLVFDMPKTATDLKAFIEEGPFITNCLLQEDKKVFPLK